MAREASNGCDNAARDEARRHHIRDIPDYVGFETRLSADQWAGSQPATGALALDMRENQHKTEDDTLHLTCSGPVARAAQRDALSPVG